MNSVTAFSMAPAGMLTFRDTEEGLFFEQSLDAIVAQRRCPHLLGDLLVRIVHLSSSELVPISLFCEQRKRSENVFDVCRLSAHEFLESVNFSTFQRDIDVFFGDLVSAFLLGESSSFIKHIDRLSRITVLACGEGCCLRDNTITENFVSEGIPTAIQDCLELCGIIRIEYEFVIL
jgi:hypothetical protein